MKTFIANKKNMTSAARRWYLVDANGVVLGRMAARVASIIKGKHKPIYTPHVDTGDYVVVVNAEKVRVTGRKLKEKKYLRFSGYPGGQKSASLEVMLKTKPTEVVKRAVRRMLPAGPLYRDMIKKLKVYKDAEHPFKKTDFVNLEIN
ncbi:MAG: 50S ribosomal protein L13 [Deltaproteobacteria bacterium]